MRMFGFEMSLWCIVLQTGAPRMRRSAILSGLAVRRGGEARGSTFGRHGSGARKPTIGRRGGAASGAISCRVW
jgi:hypothetical protein